MKEKSTYEKTINFSRITSTVNGRRHSNGGTCFGDSGGPAFWTEDETEILVGITSWGDAVCVASGFNYRVDIPETLDFIEDVIDDLTD